MSDKTIKARQNGHEVRGFIESQGIIINWDGNRVTCDIDDLIGVVLTLCAYERSLERERCARIADAYNSGNNIMPIHHPEIATAIRGEAK